MNSDFTYFDELEGSNFKRDATLLLQPDIPMPLHGVNPRTIFGKHWWKETRLKAIDEQGKRCAACGASRSTIKGKCKWLEGHEIYDINYVTGIVTYLRTVALCSYCHMFIHSSRLEILHKREEMITQTYNDIINHGKKIIFDNGLTKEYDNRHKVSGKKAKWEDFVLIIEKKEYPMKFSSYPVKSVEKIGEYDDEFWETH